jgi:hypothetical protein
LLQAAIVVEGKTILTDAKLHPHRNKKAIIPDLAWTKPRSTKLTFFFFAKGRLRHVTMGDQEGETQLLRFCVG